MDQERARDLNKAQNINMFLQKRALLPSSHSVAALPQTTQNSPKVHKFAYPRGLKAYKKDKESINHWASSIKLFNNLQEEIKEKQNDNSFTGNSKRTAIKSKSQADLAQANSNPMWPQKGRVYDNRK